VLARLVAAVRACPNGMLLRLYVIRVAMHFHFHELTLRQHIQDSWQIIFISLAQLAQSR
jgi:hypothetical protein